MLPQPGHEAVNHADIRVGSPLSPSLKVDVSVSKELGSFLAGKQAITPELGARIVPRPCR